MFLLIVGREQWIEKEAEVERLPSLANEVGSDDDADI